MFELTFVFFALAMFFVSLYIGYGMLSKGKRYFKKGKRLADIEEEHERLREQLRNLKHHYYWAQSNGEKAKEKAMEKQIFEVEDKIEELAEDYRIYKSGGDVPLRKIPKKD